MHRFQNHDRIENIVCHKEISLSEFPLIHIQCDCRTAFFLKNLIINSDCLSLRQLNYEIDSLYYIESLHF